MKLAFFDTKPYDKPGFDEHIAGTDIEIKYFETRLGEDTVQLAKGFDGVCVFVNDTVNAKVVNELYDLGVRVVALRCAGFNNVDTKACFGKLHVFRVPAYSPYAVAEHAMALLLTVNRHTNKAYIRTRDFNFSLSGLTGFDLHGKTAGVVGTGKIQGEPLDIEITSLEYDGTIIPVELAVYDTDGQPGIFIPNSMEMNAVREVAANMGGSLGSSINISTNAGAQLASDLGKGLIQGTSQYIAKKMRTVKVHLKAGYKVMLYQDRN